MSWRESKYVELSQHSAWNFPRYLLTLKLSISHGNEVKQKVTSKRLKVQVEILAVSKCWGDRN